MDEGATLSEEDIQQIPPSPPPYKSALIKPEVKPIKAESSAVKHSDKNAENKGIFYCHLKRNLIKFQQKLSRNLT